jgi:hypothetical protein
MRELKLIIKGYMPAKAWGVLVKTKSFIHHNFVDLCTLYLIQKVPRRHQKALELVRKKESVKVAFFLTHESVWKYGVLYDLMLHHTKFEPELFVCPVVNFGKENMIYEMDKTYNGFKKNGYKIIKTYNNETGEYLDIKNTFSPDIVFFTNPHEGLQDYRYYIKQFAKTLTCYVPYGVSTINYELDHLLGFHNLVWKIFTETSIHKEIAVQKQRNKGSNRVVTGFPGFDPLLTSTTPKEVWKNKNPTLKRIIWTPHHLMHELNKGSNFLEYYDFFLELAANYKDQLQITFNPHPLLRIKLEKDPNWGKEKTDIYFNKWVNLENGQYGNGSYTDLFLTSDALIHDSISFMSEYLVTGKPSLFMIRNESIMEYWNVYGEKVLALHYQSRNQKQVIDFIENVVLKENDCMKAERNNFVRSTLLQKNEFTASQNILNYLENELFR